MVSLMAMEKLAAVRSIPAFAELPVSTLRAIADAAGLQHIGQGSVIFHEGEQAHFVYAIIEGHIALLSQRNGNESIADFMGVGEIVLIAPALLAQPYMVSGQATQDVLALLIPAGAFRKLIAEHAPMGDAIARTLARHWRLLLGQLKQVKTTDANSRLAQYLIDNAGKASGSVRMTLPGSKRQLAAHLGMTPETLSRSLRRLSDVGVSTDGRSIAISSLAQLNAFVHPQANQLTESKQAHIRSKSK